MNFKKLLLFIAIFIAILAFPFIALMDSSMEFYQSLVEKSPQTSFARWAQLRIAGAYYATMRYSEAADAYYKFLDRYRDDDHRKDVLYYYATSLDYANKNAEAVNAYESYINFYPDDERVEDIKKAIIKVKHLKPSSRGESF